MAEDVRKVLKGEAMPMELFTFRDILSGYTPPGSKIQTRSPSRIDKYFFGAVLWLGRYLIFIT